jgi:hypothetical protein
MRRYVELLPDAADAQAARDKLIIWESKAQLRQKKAKEAAAVDTEGKCKARTFEEALSSGSTCGPADALRLRQTEKSAK